MNATQFQTGQTVEGGVAVQGLVVGRRYIVKDVLSQATPFGTFVTYIIMDGSKDLAITNGHLVLRNVTTKEVA